MGHQRAAAAVARALEQLPGVSTQVEDTLDHAHALFRRGYSGSYLRMADRLPGLWSQFYARTDTPQPGSLIASIRTLSTAAGVRGLPELLEYTQPDAIVCIALSAARGAGASARLPPAADRMCRDRLPRPRVLGGGRGRPLLCNRRRRRAPSLIAAGLPAARVNVSGIPIDPGLTRPVDRAARRGLGLAPWERGGSR